MAFANETAELAAPAYKTPFPQVLDDTTVNSMDRINDRVNNQVVRYEI